MSAEEIEGARRTYSAQLSVEVEHGRDRVGDRSAETPAANRRAAETPAANRRAAETPAANRRAAETPAANRRAAETPAANRTLYEGLCPVQPPLIRFDRLAAPRVGRIWRSKASPCSTFDVASPSPNLGCNPGAGCAVFRVCALVPAIDATRFVA
jgi:biotin carboxyl carrier protein